MGSTDRVNSSGRMAYEKRKMAATDKWNRGKGELATNAQLVEKAAGVVTGMGARLIGPQEVRERLKLAKR
jgi:hypothetical protein